MLRQLVPWKLECLLEPILCEVRFPLRTSNLPDVPKQMFQQLQSLLHGRQMKALQVPQAMGQVLQARATLSRSFLAGAGFS